MLKLDRSLALYEIYFPILDLVILKFKLYNKTRVGLNYSSSLDNNNNHYYNYVQCLKSVHAFKKLL